MSDIVPRSLRLFVRGKKRARRPWQRLGKGGILAWYGPPKKSMTLTGAGRPRKSATA